MAALDTHPSGEERDTAAGQAPAGGNAFVAAYRWLDERLGIGMVVHATLLHPVPRSVNWWYVLGSAVLTTFIIQVVTGVFLAFTYAPTPDHAYASLDYITHQQVLGGVLRGIHYWGASAMVTLIFAHMAAHFLTGSYKYPRELQWVTGVFLLFATLVMAFSGQVLRWNQDAYWGLSVAIAQAARTPLVGPFAAQLLAAGPEINGQALTHFYIIHMLIVPGGIFALIGVHLYLVIYKGISEWPTPGEPVDPRTYWAEYQEILQTDSEPFFPTAIFKDAVIALLVILVVAWLAIAFGGPALGIRANPTVPANPKPDWEFIWYFAVLASIPPASTDAVIILAPLISFLLLLTFPLFNRGERHYRRRPWALGAVGTAIFGFLVLTVFGYQEPWHPVLVGLDKGQANVESLPAADLQGLNPLALQGAHLMQAEACLACHTVQGVGGIRGPDLTNVADRLSYNQLVTRIAFGGTNMPAYGKQLTGDELAAIVAFLLTRNDGAPLQGNPGGP